MKKDNFKRIKQYKISGVEVNVVQHSKKDFEAYCIFPKIVSSILIKQQSLTVKESLENLLIALEALRSELKKMQEEIKFHINNL